MNGFYHYRNNVQNNLFIVREKGVTSHLMYNMWIAVSQTMFVLCAVNLEIEDADLVMARGKLQCVQSFMHR